MEYEIERIAKFIYNMDNIAEGINEENVKMKLLFIEEKGEENEISKT